MNEFNLLALLAAILWDKVPSSPTKTERSIEVAREILVHLRKLGFDETEGK